LCLRSDGIGDRGRERCNVISCCMDAFAITASLFIYPACFRFISFLSSVPFVSNILHHLLCHQHGSHPVQLLHFPFLFSRGPFNASPRICSRPVWAGAFYLGASLPFFLSSSHFFAFTPALPCLDGRLSVKGREPLIFGVCDSRIFGFEILVTSFDRGVGCGELAVCH
jgi:hypothetical protein